MPPPSAAPQTYDCIVVGAGMAGLTFAALASGHRDVLVIDQHYLPGGSFTAFKKDGYLFNVALEWTNECAPGERLHSLLRTLGLEEEYRFVRIEMFKSVMAPGVPLAIDIPTGTEPLRASLVRHFPRQSAQIEAFLADCLAVAGNDKRGQSILLRHGIQPVEKMLAAYFSDPLLAHALFSLIAYPAARGVLLMYMVGAICTGNVWRPAHRDHRKLPALLHRKIHRHGGKVMLGKRVRRILVEDGIARGVELDDGGRLYAATVVANTDPYQLYRGLLDLPPEPPPAAAAMLAREPSLSCFCLFLGLDRPVAGLDPRQPNYALLAASPQPAGELGAIPLRLEMQTAHHPQLAPPGHATLCVWAAQPIAAFDFWGQGGPDEIHDRAAYDRAKARASAIVVARLAEAFPALRDSVVAMEAATPFTFKRYVASHAGAVSGYTLAHMSYLKTLPSATHIGGLFHVGQWTTQSGVNMAMYSGSDLHAALYPAAAEQRPASSHSDGM